MLSKLIIRMSITNTMALSEEILNFWFRGFTSETDYIKETGSFWWRTPPEVAEQMRNLVGNELENALEGRHDDWTETPRGTLALILLLDQWTRSIFKGTPAAFAGDLKAQAITLDAINKGFDKQLWPIQRSFLYMPLEHSELLEHHDLMLRLMNGLVEEARGDVKPIMEGFTRFEIMHRDLIVRYGRYPHRNPILGRQSTPDEEEYLKINPNPF
ncbi:unnamed protein product [Blepharisma stoltei]|uniref:DUF924 domain-containing protein n=1 Tax=Blepharisma stoltei TaxID=1481888 RepID=A0AAU9K0H2_9CILI|nr:unnamed protein product [Blepharisma stoltei]